MLTRRRFLKLSGGTLLVLSGCKWSLPWGTAESSPPASDFLDRFGPMNPHPSGTGYVGNDFTRAHALLHDLSGYFDRHPEPAETEEASVVVVGGGIAGLTTAYLLRRHRPVILEQGPRLGGNSQGQFWDGIPHSIGAAYMVQPDAGSPLGNLCREWGLEELCQTAPPGVVGLEGRLYPDAGAAGTPVEQEAFRRLTAYLEQIYNEGDGALYPAIPVRGPAAEKVVRESDPISFHAHLERVARGPLPPVVLAAVEYYCWSAFGASCREISASAGLNFLSSETAPRWVAPGGNGALAGRILERTLKEVPAGHFRTGALVARVQVSGPHGEVLYEDTHGRLKKIKARAVVLACPKYVVKRIVPELEPDRLAAIASLQYRAYVVGNVRLESGVTRKFYDLFLLDRGVPAFENPSQAARDQGATDLIVATVNEAKAGPAVLTLYRALPYAGGNGELLAPGAMERFQRELETQTRREILPLLGLPDKEVTGIRMARWGHALPVPHVGCYSGDLVPRLTAPHKGRVFFVAQDNWLLPAFETAVEEALHWAPKIEATLKG